MFMIVFKPSELLSFPQMVVLHHSSDSFECTKKSLLKLRKTKNILAKFSYPKELSQNGKFGAPENPAIIPFTLTSEYPPPPTPPPPLLWCCHCDILISL